MRVCDVVLNSIWYDPRVRKQIIEYRDNGVDITAVGLNCQRYDPEKIRMIPCNVTIVKIDSKYDGYQSNVLKKVKREYLRIKGIKDAIVNYHPDIIHANDLDALIPAYFACRKLHCKLVYDSHEINVENYTSDRKAFRASVMTKVERYLVKRVNLMVCVSNAAAEYFASTYNINKPMVVTNCSLKKEILTDFDEKHSGFEIINHGQFYPGRGFEEMIEVAELIKQYKDIRICVRGFGRLEESMRKNVIEKKVDNFVFYPPVNVEQLISEASLSHVGIAITKPICLNFKLSVSNKLFEYTAAGLPVIMSDIPEHRYLNNKYNFGIIVSDDLPSSMSEAILRLYNDPALYQQLANNAKRMSREINWENEFKKLLCAEKNMLNA